MTQKSTHGYTFSFGSAVFSWNLRKQEVVAQSSIEAKYISALEATNKAIWLRKSLFDLGLQQNEVWVDNKSSMSIAKETYQGEVSCNW